MSKCRSRRSAKLLQLPKTDAIVKEENSNDDVPICRICMRNSTSNVPLSRIEDDVKNRIQVVLKQKILRRNPYQYICLMCCNLLEIIVDFKDAALRASQLLSTGKPLLFDADDEWHQSSEAVTICKNAVQANLQYIIAACEESIELKQEPQPDIALSEKEDCPDDTSIPETSLIKKEPIKCDTGSKSASDNDDDVEDDDFVPPPENEEDEKSSSESIEDKDDEDFSLAPKPKAKKKKDEAMDQPKRPRKKRRMKDHYKFQPELCALCGKRVCAASVESHMNQHRGVKPYNCTIPGCTLEFYSLYLLKRHLHRSHNAAGVKTHKCHICGKVIRGHKGYLTEHIRTHEIKERNFICKICGKGFTLNRYLKQHGMVHSEEFPHACSFCGKRFNNKWSMRTHEKIHQKRGNPPTVPETETTGYAVQSSDVSWTDADNVQLMNIGVE